MRDCLNCWLFYSVAMGPLESHAESQIICVVNSMSGSLEGIFHVGVGKGEGRWCSM